MYRHYVKHILDFAFAVIILFLLFPVFMFIFLWLTAQYKGNAFFTQIRPGQHAKFFKIIKFKTMTDERDANGKVSRYNSIIIVQNIDRILSLEAHSCGFKKIA